MDSDSRQAVPDVNLYLLLSPRLSLRGQDHGREAGDPDEQQQQAEDEQSFVARGRQTVQSRACSSRPAGAA